MVPSELIFWMLEQGMFLSFPIASSDTILEHACLALMYLAQQKVT